MRIGIIVAMDKELNLFLQDMSNTYKFDIFSDNPIYRGKIGEHNVFLCKSGIGKVNASLMTSYVINTYKPDLIINSGVCGGLNPNYKPGDVLIATKTSYHDVWCGDGTLYGQSDGCPLEFDIPTDLILTCQRLFEGKTYFGQIVTGDKFITTPKDVFDIKDNFPNADGCDMESAAISHTCLKYNIPHMVIRVMSDVPGGVRHVQDYNEFWNNVPKKTFEVVKTFLKNYEN